MLHTESLAVLGLLVMAETDYKLMPWRVKHQGFTIVELLIVIVVIGILAVITVVAYNGVQNRAKISSVSSALSQAARKVGLYQAENGRYPTTTANAGISDSGNISYQYNADANGTSYCMTALIEGKLPYKISNTSSVSAGACDGHSNGESYCPENSYVPINGYYCNGTENSIADLNNNVTKLSASNSEVPAGAPAAYVGRQSSRDNYIGNSFTIVPGEVYCVEGWGATNSSTVPHTIGIRGTKTDGTQAWANVSYINPSAGWQKISGCITVAAGFVTGLVWSQNNGVSGGTATASWYQTAIKVTKQ